MDSLSGELRVVGGSRRRRGVRRPGRASCNSRMASAGSDAASTMAASESAHASAAHAASRESDAVPAKPQAEEAARTPENESGATDGPAEGEACKLPPGLRFQYADEEFQKPEAAPKKKQERPKQPNEPKTKKKKDATLPEKSGGDTGGNKPIESLWDERVHLDGGEDLPPDGGSFVDAVNEYVDLVRLTDSLLRERDEKSSKSLLEKLLEMKYGKGTKTESGGARSIMGGLPGSLGD
jgi:hypothetical protein